MITRIIVLVVDGLGVGALPDAGAYGDAGCNTLERLAAMADGLALPNLEQLGLGHLGSFRGIRRIAQPEGCFGQLGFITKGKNSLTGFWELAGFVIEHESQPSTTFTPELATALEAAIGQKTVGNRMVLGTEWISEVDAQHRKSGMPIAWIDETGTIFLAAHEHIISADELYRLAREARRLLKSLTPIVRVVAYPYSGPPGHVQLSDRRRDFAVEPPGPTLLDQLSRASQLVITLGKVGDLFSGRGVTRTISVSQPEVVMDEIAGMFSKVPRGLIFANLSLLSFDLHATVASLQQFDRRLRELQQSLKQGDVLIVTADHGFDCARPTPGHSREYVPCLVTGPRLARGVNLGTRPSAADLGQTIGEALGATRLPWGDSFLDSLRAG
jgi:phosphopentomutase